VTFSPTTTAAFSALTVALVALWVGRRPLRSRLQPWVFPCVVALALALVARLIDLRGLIVLLSFGGLCVVARNVSGRVLTVVAHALMLMMCAALFLHILPGFDNPRVVTDVVLGDGSEPYTKYLNVDKGMAGLFLLGLYAPDRTRSDQGLRHSAAFAWRFALLAVVAMALAFALGYVRWDPKLPEWWPMWAWSMVFLTALPEEAIFRAVAQSAIASWIGTRKWGTAIAIAGSGLLFGLGHAAGGPAYVVLATVAGVGYGWIYASTRSIAAAILAHAGLNTIHFLFFSYPALRSGL
jgi:uncharacterized protein